MYTTRNTDSISKHINEIKKQNKYTIQEQDVLASHALEGDLEARTELFNANLGLSIHLAKRYVRRAVLLEDLISEANLSLVRSLDSYKLGNNFPSWAYTCITRDLKAYLDKHGHTVKFSKHQRELGNEPLNINIFSEMVPGLTDFSYEDMLPGSVEQEEEEDRLDFNENLREVFENLLPLLSQRQQEVIRLRFYEQLPLKDIVTHLGISNTAILMSEKKALAKLKSLLDKNN